MTIAIDLLLDQQAEHALKWLLKILYLYPTKFIWIPGHNEIRENEIADDHTKLWAEGTSVGSEPARGKS